MSKYTNDELCNKVADIKYDVQQVLDALYSREHEIDSLKRENANLTEQLKIEVNHVNRLQSEIFKLMDELDQQKKNS